MRRLMTIGDVQEYLIGIVGRAHDHGKNVEYIIFALMGGVLWAMDHGSVMVMERQGEMTAVLWVQIKNKRYAFSFDHNDNKIQMKRGNLKGSVIHTFTNHSTQMDVYKFFEALTK